MGPGMVNDRNKQDKEPETTGDKNTPVTTEKNNDNVRAVDRALDILLAFTTTDYELTVAELLKRVDLRRPTLYRLLYTLEQSGFLIASGDPQRFRFGPAVARLAHIWSSSLDITGLAQPMMTKIWEATGETVALFVPQGAFRLCIAELPSPQPLSFKRGVGYRENILLGASGRAILASTNISEQELARYAQGLQIDLSRYSQELRSIKSKGYAMSQNELINGATAVAVPFFDGSGEVAGSIGVFGPSVRLAPKEIKKTAELLRAQSILLSNALGYLD